MSEKTILIAGTFDTKEDELGFLSDCILQQGGKVLRMDVSVLGDAKIPVDFSKHDVAGEGGHTIQEAIDSGDENTAMQIMAKGASLLALRLHREKKFDGVIILGGTMGTDLALDVTAALPLGVPKYIVSTVSFSPLLPPERLAPDVQMILWAGGLYGLNGICRSSLSQAAGAVLGAARAVTPPEDRPLIGVTSLGTSALRYIITLKPELERRGYEVAVFHATGMGGRAFEALAAQGAFSCVFDFCTQELGNHVHGSNISAGPDRLTGAGLAGVPQIVAAGCYDLVDFCSWQTLDEKWKDHPYHAHNRLIGSVILNSDERRAVARAHAGQLSKAKGPTAFILTNGGCGEWDRPGADLHDPEGLRAFCDEFRKVLPPNIEFHDVPSHIGDPDFVTLALSVFDEWKEAGKIR